MYFIKNRLNSNKKGLICFLGATLAVAVLLSLNSCNKLDINPKAIITEDDINSPNGAEKLVIAAYSQLGNDHYDQPFSLWPYGDVRSDDAYKGGRDESDIQDFHFIETFYNTRTDMTELDQIWYNMYIGISRVNAALNTIESLTDAAYPLKTQRMAEMRFLRAHWYFQLKILYKFIPYIDENVPRGNYDTVGNRVYTNDQLWEKIAQDFQYAADNLPDTKTDIGRMDKTAAYAYLAKTRLYQAYTQDDKNNVTGINQADLLQVVANVDKVVASKYHLTSDMSDNFVPGTFQNGPESIFAVQFSTNDGTLKGRLNFGDVLSVPQGLGCCDFKKPSQNLVNAYKTDANGLPLMDTYNNTNVDPYNDNIDPRLDHTVAMAGRTWKYDTAHIYQNTWNRSPDVYGTYASLKENISPSSDEFVNIDPFYGNAKPRIILRFADILLMKAEALVELGRQDEALPIINEIRDRARISTARLLDKSGNLEGHYNVGIYVPGTNITWSQDNARKAVRFERRLEMAEEGCRFFDLVRWGIADQVLNSYFTTEKVRRPFLSSAYFTKNKHEYLPIPVNQIYFSKNLYQQNYGY